MIYTLEFAVHTIGNANRFFQNCCLDVFRSSTLCTIVSAGLSSKVPLNLDTICLSQATTWAIDPDCLAFIGAFPVLP